MTTKNRSSGTRASDNTKWTGNWLVKQQAMVVLVLFTIIFVLVLVLLLNLK